MSTTSTRGSFLEFPCVSDEIARWTCTFEANSWLNDEDTVAASLFRCFMLSSRHGQFKSSAQSDASELPQSNLSSLASTLFQPFVYGWQSLTSAVRIWRTSTSLFNAYARLHTHDCPWQLGYLSSGSMCWENLYVVTSRSIELIKIPCKAAQKVMSEQDYETEDEKSLSVLTELISENPRQSTDGASMNDVSTASSPIHQRWKLSYLDPWPQWRQICFSPVEDGNEGSLFKSRSAAIGYSNGSVELIQVASSEEDSADSNDSSCRKRIFVPAPSTPKSGDQRDSLLPIVFLHFIDLNHLIICHFRGHVDLWHLNWNAERYPARMMARIYPFTYIPSSSHILPLTAGAYDAISQMLVISGLPTATSHRGTTHLHESLELSCFQVSPDPPFLKYLDPRSSTNSANRGGIMAALTKARIGLGHLLSTALRRNRTDGEYQEDGIATLSVLSSHEGLIAGAVHFCGSCSVWSLPGLEPLLVVISSDPSLPMQPSPPNTCLLTNTSQPYRLTWWRIPPTACINAADNHSVPECNYYMAVLLNDGTFNMIDLKNPETGWFALPERQAAELHLSSHPSFIYNEANSVSDCSQSTTLLFLDHKRVSTHSDSTLSQTDGATYTYDIRAVRLISTTPLGLFGHLIASADYTEAVKLAEKHKFDVELVYQQQWLDLSVTESDFKKFPDLVKSTLALIKNRPFWVMKQCVLFLPSNTIPSSPSSPRDLLAAVRCVLDHGIKVLQMIQDKPEYKDHLGLIKNRLLRQLFHIDCLESIIPAEIFDSSNSKPVLKMISESLKAFRRYSFLVLTLNYAHSGQYEIAKFLMNKLPLTIGQHRLAIVATLPETMDPALYADALLYPSFPPEKEPNGVAQPELEASVLNALYSVSTEDDGEKLKPVTTDDPVEYAKLLSKWVIRRAKQIDTRSGLTSFAVALLRAGQNICQKLISANPKAKRSVGDIEDCLNGLKKSLWDFSELAELIYCLPAHVSRGVKPTRVALNLRSNARRVALSRLHLTTYANLSTEERLDLMVQLWVTRKTRSVKPEQPTPGGNFGSGFLEFPLFFATRILPFILKRNSDSISRVRGLCTFVLLCTANHADFEGPTQLMATLQRTKSLEIPWYNLTTNRSSVNDPVMADVPTSAWKMVQGTDILESMIQVISQFEPNFSADDPTDTNQNRPYTFPIYVKEIKDLIKILKSYLNTLQLSEETTSSNKAMFSEISAQLQNLTRFLEGFHELHKFAESLKLRCGCNVPIGLSSVKDVINCSKDGRRMSRFLGGWMVTFTRSIPHLLVGVDDSSVSRPPVDEIIEQVAQFYKILSRMFAGSPCEQNLSTQFQFCLLSAGSEVLCEVSQRLQLGVHSRQEIRVLPEKAMQSTWCVLLLQSLRIYMNTLRPQALSLNALSVKPFDQLEPNERMARRYISLFHTMPTQSDIPVKVRTLFVLEENLLDATALLSTAWPYIPADQRTFSLIPHQLRESWTSSAVDTSFRSNILSTAFLGLLIAYHKSSVGVHRFLKLVKTGYLEKIAISFHLTTEQSSCCFTRAVYSLVASAPETALPPELTNYTLEILYNFMRKEYSDAWLDCAHWAGCNPFSRSEVSWNENPTAGEQISDVTCSSEWTCLHSLFLIPKPSDRHLKPQLNVEELRLRLSRFSLAHCPNDRLKDIFNLVTVSTYRVECAQIADSAHQLESDAWICKVNNGSGSIIFVPHFYLTFSQLARSEGEDSLAKLLGKEGRSVQCTLTALETQWWQAFLVRGYETPLKKVPGSSWVNLCLESLSRDTRLCLSYISFACNCATSTVREPDSHHIISSIAQSLTPQSNKPLAPFKQNVSLCEDRGRVVAGLVCFASRREGVRCHGSPPACFFSGRQLTEILAHYSQVDKALLPTSVFKFLHCECWSAVKQCTSVRLRNLFPRLDLSLFEVDGDYRAQMVERTSELNLALGIRLAMYTRFPIEHALHARAKYLVNTGLSSNKEREEFSSIVRWVAKFPKGTSSFVSWASESLFPHITDLSTMHLFFTLLPTDPKVPTILDLPISSHVRILAAITKAKDCEQLFKQIPYSQLIELLYTDHSGSFLTHPLYQYVESEAVVTALSEILAILFQHTSRKPSVLAGDLHALHSLHCFQDSASLAAYRTKDPISSSLLSSISPSDDPQSASRLIRWLDDLIFGANSKNVSVDLRCFILQDTVNFIRKQLNNTKSVVNWPPTLEVVRRYLGQIEQIVKLLGTVQFPNYPAEQSTERNSGSSEELPTGFYAQLLLLKPGDEESTVSLLKQLIDAVRVWHFDNSSADEAESDKRIRWLGKNFPSCMSIFQLDDAAVIQLLVQATVSALPTFPSKLEAALSELQSVSSPAASVPERSNDQVIYKLIHDLATCDPQSDAGDSKQKKVQLIGALFSNESFRRHCGRRFVDSLAKREQLTNESEPLYPLLFLHSLRFISDSFKSHGPLNSLIGTLETNYHTADDDGCMQLVREFAESFVSSSEALDSSSSIENYSDTERLAELLQSVIEIASLLFSSGTGSPSSEAKPLDGEIHLWTCWFTFCLRTKLFQAENGRIGLWFLIDQWSAYVHLPSSMALASLLQLDSYLDNKSGQIEYWPPGLQANVIGLCLYQADRALVTRCLEVIAKVDQPGVFSSIDAHVCQYFAVVHGSLWPQIFDSENLASGPSASLFLLSRICRGVENYFSTNSRFSASLQKERSVFGEHCLALYRRCGLWIEAARLCKFLYECPANDVSLESFIRLAAGSFETPNSD